MNLSFLIKKKHIFKRRKFFKYLNQLNTVGRGGIYTKNQILFQLTNLKTFKKILRKKYYKKNLNFKLAKYWLMIRPNFLLTMKSKNSRMGVGVGKYVRVASIIKADIPIFLFKNYGRYMIKSLVNYVKMKMNINLYIQFPYKKSVKVV
jgi:ribosomal protein L16/L10AE